MEENKTYTITLADGTVIENLTMNGNCFVSFEALDPKVFEGNCSPVIIDDKVHDNMTFVESASPTGEYYFGLIDVPESELERIKTKSDIEYLAMMTGVEL